MSSSHIDPFYKEVPMAVQELCRMVQQSPEVQIDEADKLALSLLSKVYGVAKEAAIVKSFKRFLKPAAQC